MTTLLDYKYGSSNASSADTAIRKIIAETMVSESPFLSVLDFEELTDNNISRQRMYFESDVQEHEVGGTWTIVNPTWQYRDSPLTVLGDNVTVDSFGALASGDKEAALMASNIMEKSRGMSRRFDKLAIYAGTTSTGGISNSNMVGLLTHIARIEGATVTDLDGWLYSGNDGAANNTQALFGVSGASVALSLAMIGALRDAVRPKATHMLMSRLMRRKVEALCQAAGQNLVILDEKAGQVITKWGDVQILVNDQIKDNMDDSTALVTDIASYDYAQATAGGSDTSPIFCVSLAREHFTGINGQGMIQVENLAGGGALENLDAKGKRIKAYLGTALRQHRSAAVLLNTNYGG